jgi:membrane protein implicated in regulation of membrane protease activity
MDSPEQWRWIWLVGAFLFALAEMGSPGSFFMLPFAVGALVAAVLAFADVGLAAQWIAFIGISVASLAALRPLARRLDLADDDRGVGSRRLIGQSAVVLQEIPGRHELGLVRVHREEWRAESLDGSPIPPGTTVKVAEVAGTRVLVLAADQITPPAEGVDRE